MKMYLHVCSKTVLRLESEEAFVKYVRYVSQRSIRGLVAAAQIMAQERGLALLRFEPDRTGPISMQTERCPDKVLPDG